MLMDFFTHKYPRTNFHELNLDWCISAITELQEAFEGFTAGNKLIFADPLQHDLTKTYAKNTIVVDSVSGSAYLSLKPVPAGVQLDNTDYWLPVFDFAGYVTRANQNFTDHYFSGTDRTPIALAVDDWVVLDDVLYKVTVSMDADDLFIIGTNIVHFTVEQFLKDFVTSVNTTLTNWYNQMTSTINQYKNDIDASELAYRNQLAQDIADTTASLQSQLDAAISGATVDSEVINGRVDLNGYIWPTLGDAIRNQIERVTSISDVISNIMNDTTQSFTLLQGFHGTNKGVFTPNSQQAETDFIAVPDGTTITVKCSVNTTQCFIKEWTRITDGYNRLRNVIVAAGTTATISDTSSDYFYTMGGYNANDIDASDSHITITIDNRLNQKYDQLATAPIDRTDAGITDCNLMTDQGFYKIDTTGYTNIPPGLTSNGILFTFKANMSTRLMQILGSYGTCDIWIRNAGSNNGFTEWSKLNTNKGVKIVQENADQFAISFGKAKIQLVHTVNNGLYQDNWNLQNIYKGNDLIVPSGSDIIGPISLNNTFIGGVHGYETTTDVSFIADGVMYDISTIPDLFCDRLQVLIKSEVYDPSDPENTAIAVRYIKLTFTSDKMEVESNYQALKAFTADRCYVGGMISAKNDILIGIALNNMFISAPTASVSGTIKKCNTNCSMLTDNGTVTLNVTKGFEEPDYVGKIIVYANETPIRSKFYGDIQGTGTRSLSIGDDIHGAFEITVN